MAKRCREFRDEWLERALDEGVRDAVEQRSVHLRSCEACQAWLQATSLHVQVLTSLERPDLPRELGEAVQDELGRQRESHARMEAVLRSLPALPVPDELEARVNELFASGFEGVPLPAGAERVSVMDYASVPPVLDRLVAEELAQPAVHRVERFAGDLERIPAPEVLERRVGRTLRRRSLPVAGIATLAAACLVIWFTFGRTRDELSRRQLRVVRVESAGALSPLARGLALSLGGGAPASPDTEGG